MAGWRGSSYYALDRNTLWSAPVERYKGTAFGVIFIEEQRLSGVVSQPLDRKQRISPNTG